MPATTRRPRPTVAVLASAVLVITLAGCSVTGTATATAGAANVTASARPPLSSLTVASNLEGPSTATLVDAAIDPVANSPKPVLPAQVTSHDPSGDVPVTVTTAKRVIAIDISGSLAGTVYGLGLGARLVARDVATTIPSALALPLATTADGQSVNAETILGLTPDLVITDGTVGPTDVVQQLRDSGIAVVYVDNEKSFAGAGAMAEQVADALGVPAVGDELAARIASQVAATERQIAQLEPERELRMVFLYLRGASGIYYLFGSGSGADELIDGLQGIDAAKEIHWSGMKPMTDEGIVAMNPDLILVMTDGLASAGGLDGLLRSKPAIALTTAGQNRRIVDMADGDILSFGPRSAQILDALARAIYAP